MCYIYFPPEIIRREKKELQMIGIPKETFETILEMGIERDTLRQLLKEAEIWALAQIPTGTILPQWILQSQALTETKT